MFHAMKGYISMYFAYYSPQNDVMVSVGMRLGLTIIMSHVSFLHHHDYLKAKSFLKTVQCHRHL